MYTAEENEYFARQGSIRYLDVNSSLAYDPVFFSVTYVKVKRPYTYREHVHPSFEIIIPEKKKYKCFLNGSEIELQAGEFLLVQVDDSHRDIFFPGMEFCAITFDLKSSALPNFKNRLFKGSVKPEAQRNTLPKGEAFISVYELLRKEAESNGAFAYYTLNGLFQALFWKIIAAFPENFLEPLFVKTAQEEHLRNILLDYFERNLKGKVNVADMAKALNMSESSLAHKAKRIMGASPAKAFMSYKMKRAASLLSQSGMTVKEASEALGFEDQFHFSKAFKRHFKKPPSRFR